MSVAVLDVELPLDMSNDVEFDSADGRRSDLFSVGWVGEERRGVGQRETPHLIPCVKGVVVGAGQERFRRRRVSHDCAGHQITIGNSVQGRLEESELASVEGTDRCRAGQLI